MSKTITVETDAGQVQVRKLPLGKYAEFLKIIETFSKDIGELLDKDNEFFKNNVNMVQTLLPIFIKAPDEFCKLLSLVSDKEEKFFAEEFGLDDGLDVLAAALEVNDYRAIVEKIKKIMAQVVKKPSQPAKAQ